MPVLEKSFHRINMIIRINMIFIESLSAMILVQFKSSSQAQVTVI